LLFWRSATQWIGGIGILIFALAVLPPLSPLGLALYRAEGPNQDIQTFSYSARRSVQILLRVYLGLTVLESIALVFSGVGVFDAVTTSFATIATGGFSPRNANIAHYGSSTVEVVVIVFMILSGVNFALLFGAFSGRLKEFVQSSVLRFYLLALLIGVVITTLSLHRSGFGSWANALRYSAFQVISIGTSTGFATTDSAIWPSLAQLILLFFTLQCACAGSTSGGIKADRVLIFLKFVVKRIKEVRHPKAIVPIRLNQNVMDDGIAGISVLYIPLYIGLVFVSAALLTAMGVDGISAFSGSAATMGNVGPGLGGVGSVGNFGGIPAAGKWVLSVTMLLGRLEVYGLIICLVPYYWKS
jgi:trk system potassium uptake protein TrkH